MMFDIRLDPTHPKAVNVRFDSISSNSQGGRDLGLRLGNSGRQKRAWNNLHVHR